MEGTARSGTARAISSSSARARRRRARRLPLRSAAPASSSSKKRRSWAAPRRCRGRAPGFPPTITCWRKDWPIRRKRRCAICAPPRRRGGRRRRMRCGSPLPSTRRDAPIPRGPHAARLRLVHHPDLYVEAPGGRLHGRMVSPRLISRNLVGPWRDRIRSSTMPQIFTYGELVTGTAVGRPLRTLARMAPRCSIASSRAASAWATPSSSGSSKAVSIMAARSSPRRRPNGC